MMKNPRNLLIFAGLGGVVGFLIGLTLSNFGGNAETAERDIRNVLNRQVEGWNSGDINAYIQFYQKGDALRFASGGDVETGWQSTLDRYLKRYPDRSTMGRLETENLDVEIVDSDDAIVFGTWELIRDGDRPSGLYTLHMKKIKGDWVVVSDHTSSAN